MVLPECSKVPVTLRRAYLEARYRLDTTPPLTLRIGRPCAELNRLHARYGVSSSAYLTACNPHGKLLPEANNRQRMTQLLNELNASQRRFLMGTAEDPAGVWPAEQSVLIVGISMSDATNLALHYEQNALVFIGADNTPRLTLLR